MLHRRSIRTKLVYALVVLTLIFCFLTFSAIWGASRYRQLADSVSQQAIEIPHANHLHRCAQTIRQSYERGAKLRDRPGMIEALIATNVKAEHDTILDTLMELDFALERYSNQLNTSSDEVRLLVDKSRQLDSLAKIAGVKNELNRLWSASPVWSDQESMPLNGDARFKALASDLVSVTQSHLDLIHSEMERFSQNVNGHYKGWIWLNLICIASVIILVLLLWFSFQSLVAKPFRTLLDGSRLVASGQYGHRIDLGTSDELNELAEAMNSMSTKFRDVYDQQKSMNEELDRQVKARAREVIQNEQLAGVGFLAAGVAHEINNPLATIAWSAESLQGELEDLLMSGTLTLSDEYCHSLQINLKRVQDEAYRCKGITERLLDFSRLGDISRSSLDLGALVQDVVDLVSKLGKYRCKQLHVHCKEIVTAHANSHEIRQVVLNLITNALESVDSDGAVDVHVRNIRNQAYIGVYDNGCGMSQEVLDSLFEPFFTRRRDGTGTGLGLSITYRIVSQHHGSLTANSDGEGKGSRLEMLLPVEAVSDAEGEKNQSIIGWNHDENKAA